MDASRRIFDQYDRDGSGALDRSELRLCLAELGLKGSTEAEREELREILLNYCAEVDFTTFAETVVPTVRERLAAHKQAMLQTLFQEADVDGSGSLCVNEVVRSARFLGTDPRRDDVLQALLDVDPSLECTCKALDGNWLFERDAIDHASFGVVIPLLEERTLRNRTQRLRAIATKLSLDERQLRVWEDVLLDVHDDFEKINFAEFSRFQAEAEVIRLIRQHGLTPRTEQGAPPRPGQLLDTLRNVISVLGIALAGPQPRRAHFDDDSDAPPQEGAAEPPPAPGLTFERLFQILARLRQFDTQKLEQKLGDMDFDGSGALALQEVQLALAAVGLKPRDGSEAEQIQLAVAEFDEDGSGEVDTDEFVLLCHVLAGRLHRHRRREEARVSIKLGYSEEQMQDLRKVFLSLDEDMSERLEREEVVRAIALVRGRGGAESTRESKEFFSTQGLDKDASVDFAAFVRLTRSFDELQAQKAACARAGLAPPLGDRACRCFRELEPGDDGFVHGHLVLEALKAWPELNQASLAQEIEALQTKRVRMQSGDVHKIGAINVNFEAFLKLLQKLGVQ